MAKINRKDFFKGFGIEVVDSKHIMAPWGEVVTMPLTIGTKTLCMGWSTLAGTGEYTGKFNGEEVTVCGTCQCDCPNCYAKQGNYVYQSTKDSLIWRTVASRDYTEWLERAITAQILYGEGDGKPYPLIRVHVSGDFFSSEYIEMWYSIAMSCPDTRFWSYTKYSPAEHAFDDLANFNIVTSLIPGYGVNYGDAAYVLALYEHLTEMGIPVYICRCALDEADIKSEDKKKVLVDNHQHCVNCTGCSKFQYVLFLQHSVKGYDKHKDPMFETLRKVIEAQPSMLTA